MILVERFSCRAWFTIGTLIFCSIWPNTGHAATDESAGAPQLQANKEQLSASPKPKITIGKETTYITEPLRPDGYPDYVAALNQRMSQGVTPENNAAVLLLKAFGSRAIPKNRQPQVIRQLGIQSLPESGDFLITQDKLVESRRAKLPEAQRWTADLDTAFEQALLRPWTKKEYPLVAEWLALNEKPLQIVMQAANRPNYFFPIVTDETDLPLLSYRHKEIDPLREAVNCLATRAMYKLGAGKADDAWQDLLTCHKLARFSYGPTIPDVLVSDKFEHIACSGDVRLAHFGKLKADQALKMQAQLRTLSALPKLIDVIDLGDRFTYLDSVCAVARNGLSKFGGDERNQAILASAIDNLPNWDIPLRAGNQLWDRIVATDRIPDRQKRWRTQDANRADATQLSVNASDLRNIVWDLFKYKSPQDAVGSRVAGILIGRYVGATFSLLLFEDRMMAEDSMVQMAFALAAYRAEHGAYPVKIDELVPKYLESLPDDPYAAHPIPLRYRREGDGYLLWSAGTNGKDDGGRNGYWEDGSDNGDDWVLRPIPATKKSGK